MAMVIGVMGFTKHAETGSSQVLRPDEHDQIEKRLHQLGKTSAKVLTPEERERVLAESR